MKTKPVLSDRKFYKRVFTIEVLSEEPIPPGTSTENIIFEANEGGYSMREYGEKETVLNAKQAAKALINQGSDPSFFQLNEKGEDVEI